MIYCQHISFTTLGRSVNLDITHYSAAKPDLNLYVRVSERGPRQSGCDLF